MGKALKTLQKETDKLSVPTKKALCEGLKLTGWSVNQ